MLSVKFWDGSVPPLLQMANWLTKPWSERLARRRLRAFQAIAFSFSSFFEKKSL